MCGILGIWHYDGSPVEPSVVRRATARLRHRGPDDEGYLLVNTQTGRMAQCGGRDTDPVLNLPPVESFEGQDFNLALGFRRLSILDVSPHGHQPMVSRDGKCWVIFNGEIYNYLELRRELNGHGYEFRTGTDTEVILAAYQHWGDDCLKRFIGMWALAIWDSGKRRLFVARDPFGIKPLYYINEGGRFAFASEIKALLELPSVARRANPQRLYDYLISGMTDHGDETLFAGIRQLLPSHSLAWSMDGDAREPEFKRYWQINLDKKSDLSFDEAAERLRDLFLESIGLHLRSDVPVGAALSGGIDSSSIAMSMRRLESSLDLRTFSYAADDAAINEERWIDIVGSAASAVVRKVRPTPVELVADLDDLISTQDEPFGSTSIYAQHRVFRLAHESGIKVMLDGQGADEMLAGYRMYLMPRLASLLRQGQLIRARKFMRHASTLSGLSNKFLLAGASGAIFPSLIGQGRLMPSALRPFARRAGLADNTAQSAINGEWFKQQGALPRKPAGNGHRFLLRKSLRETLVETSLPMLLRYEDRNSMAHSIESRVPFLTTPLVEFILALPEEYLLAPDGTSKSVFRRAMRGIVPDAILDRRDKIGFATPENQWLSVLQPWVQEVLESERAAQIPALNLPVIKQQWQDVLAGRQAYSTKIWQWLNVIRWVDKFEVDF